MNINFNTLEGRYFAKDTRQHFIKWVEQYPKREKELWQIARTDSSPKNWRAAWVLDYLIEKDPKNLLPYLPLFSKLIIHCKDESRARCFARITHNFIFFIYQKKNISIKSTLKLVHLNCIKDACFLWLIENKKVATEVHAMRTLAILSADFPEISENLLAILEQHYVVKSAGYKASARIVKAQLSLS